MNEHDDVIEKTLQPLADVMDKLKPDACGEPIVYVGNELKNKQVSGPKPQRTLCRGCHTEACRGECMTNMQTTKDGRLVCPKPIATPVATFSKETMDFWKNPPKPFKPVTGNKVGELTDAIVHAVGALDEAGRRRVLVALMDAETGGGWEIREHKRQAMLYYNAEVHYKKGTAFGGFGIFLTEPKVATFIQDNDVEDGPAERTLTY